MARVDDYNKAVGLGKKKLKQKDPELIADLSGAAFNIGPDDRSILSLDFLNKKVFITWPNFEFSFKEPEKEVPVQQQILLLHYLNGAKMSEATGKWIAYQEVPDGRFYLDAFLRRAKNPMVQAFGDKPESLVKSATTAYNARPFDHGDLSVIIQALPKVPVALILWRGDEEFPPEGTILFDSTIPEILSAEDIAWLAGMIIYPLIGMAK